MLSKIKFIPEKKASLTTLVSEDMSLENDIKFEIGFYNDKYRKKKGKAQVNVAQVAYWNEFGTVVTHWGRAQKPDGTYVAIPPHTTPPRPFLSKGVKNGITKFGFSHFKKGFRTKLSQRQIFRKLANRIKKEVRDTILQYKEPANRPITVELKGFNRPLYHTGKLAKSVKVKEK